MDELWQSAPALAIKVWRHSGSMAWQPNAALQRWAAARVRDTEAPWAGLAAAVAAGEASVAFAGARLSCTRVALGEAWLAWLQPPADLSDVLHRAVELASVSVWRVDLRAERVDLNDFGYRSLGLSPAPDGVPLAWVRALIHPDDLDAVTRAAEEAIATGEVVDVEARYRNADGSYRHVLTRRVAEHDADGRVVALSGVAIDQSQRVAERERARTLAQRIDIVARAAGVGLWSIDVESGAIEWNEQMFEMYGIAAGGPAPSIVETVERYVHPDDRDMVRGQRVRASHVGTTQFDFRIVRPDGQLRWLSTSSRRERGLDGRLMAYGVTMDVTERHSVEQALRDKAAAEQASRAKSDFLSRVSHELRTPLNAVLGFVQLLMHDSDERLSRRQAERVRHAHAAGRHLMALIDDVLDFAAIEANTLKLELKATPLQAAIDDVVRWTQVQAERAGVAVLVEPGAGAVLADPRRLRQIVANLLSNAIKYNRRPGHVWVGCAAGDLGGAPACVLRVRDDGRGMSLEQQAHLFEPFNRLGAERDGIEGTGIGLIIVHHLVDLMGGRIEVESEAGLGSEFRILLPAAPATAAAAPPAPPERDTQQPPSAPRDLRVLYVEDNPINVLLVQELLATRPSMRLVTAEDGTSGVAMARRSPPDVMLVDMQLPDFDGMEVLRRLRDEPGLADCTFVALSASAMPEEIQRAKAAGFAEYWTKPIDFAQFLGGMDQLAATRR